MNEKKYTQGFNAGYLIGLEWPLLYDNILKENYKSDYLIGFSNGITESNLEKTKDRLQNLKQLRKNKGITKNKDLNK